LLDGALANLAETTHVKEERDGEKTLRANRTCGREAAIGLSTRGLQVDAVDEVVDEMMKVNNK
jgi:hypothetical protein